MFARQHPPSLIGVVHLLPLPGSPAPSPGLEQVMARAVQDARALRAGGADGVIVENLGDAPFAADSVRPATVAMMTRVALAVREAVPELTLGINVLRNDAQAALGIASAVEAQFIRINVHIGAMVTDQGLLIGQARDTLLERKRLEAPVQIAADVLVKHAAPLGEASLAQVARDTWHRGRADALLVTGSGTGRPTEVADLQAVREAVPDAVLWVASGVTPSNVACLRPWIDGAIVGTWLHRNSALDQPVDAERVRQIKNLLSA